MTAPTRLLADLLPLVLPHAVGCADLIATFNLRQAAIEFCEKTRCWRHISTTELTENGEVPVVPPFAVVHQIENATVGQTRLTPIAFTNVDANTAAARGMPCYITQSSPSTLQVLPFDPCTLSLSLFLKPDQGHEYGQDEKGRLVDRYDVIPDFMYRQHAETLAHGALARILNQRGTDYYDPKTAMFYAAQFAEKATDMGAGIYSGQQRAPIRTKPSYF